jgi:LmbE family N-acetylglucosaminyl deacetylase
MVRLEERIQGQGTCMINLNLSPLGRGGLRILCLGAHSDDIEIGCGGTLMELIQAKVAQEFYWVVMSGSGKRGEEAREGAERFTIGCESQVFVKEFKDGFLPFCAAEIKEFFEELKEKVDADLIFTHWCGDAHQDHRLISELTWTTFRNNLIWEYEIPKYDGDIGRPNVFVPLDARHCERKVDHLLEVFESQQTKHWFDKATFMSLMRIRGMESNSPSGFAEAFYGRKIVVQPLA